MCVINKIRLILNAIKEELFPLTEKMTARGNHIFGGLVLDKKSLRVITAGSNDRVENPIYHGEIDTIRRFFADKSHPDPSECIFVASHDPCPMCISAISWAGFNEIWVLFDYEDVKKKFGMPVDLTMYKEVFGAAGASDDNTFYHKYYIKEEAKKQEDSRDLMNVIADLEAMYDKLPVQDFSYPGM